MTVYLKDEHDPRGGIDQTITGPTMLEQQVDALLQERITGGGGSDGLGDDEYEDDHNLGCIMMFQFPQNELSDEAKQQLIPFQ